MDSPWRNVENFAVRRVSRSAGYARYQNAVLVLPKLEGVYLPLSDPGFGKPVPPATALLADDIVTEIYATNSVFNADFRDAILHLLSEMKQLCRVQLVWDTNRYRFATPPTELTDWTWESMGKPLVDHLQAHKNLSYINVRVGHEFRRPLTRENKEWKENINGYPYLAT
jgi:hypothetical protein